MLAVLGKTVESLDSIEQAVNLKSNGNYFTGALAYGRLNVCKWKDYESLLKQ